MSGTFVPPSPGKGGMSTVVEGSGNDDDEEEEDKAKPPSNAMTPAAAVAKALPVLQLNAHGRGRTGPSWLLVK